MRTTHRRVSRPRGSQHARTQIQKFPVAISRRPHPIPSRTRKLSSSEPMVLHGKPCGRVGRRRDYLSSLQLDVPQKPLREKPTRVRGVAFFVLSLKCPLALRKVLGAVAVHRPNFSGRDYRALTRWRADVSSLPRLASSRSLR